MKNVFMEHTVKRRSSCGRGVLKLKSWNPLPRPGQDNNKQQQRSTGHVAVQSNARGTPFCNGNTERSSKKTENHPSFGVLKGSANRSEAIGSTGKPNRKLKKALVKYSYSANPERPGGFDELTVKQGEHIYIHEVNATNPHWVEAENEQGVIGHVPVNYVMTIESKPSQLPWLENKRLLREAEREKEEKEKGRGFGGPAPGKLPPKKYVSAYDTQRGAVSSEFDCAICGKSFNGPKPYRSHMVSRAHKEEEEAQRFR